jgi:hypothetical protein
VKKSLKRFLILFRYNCIFNKKEVNFYTKEVTVKTITAFENSLLRFLAFSRNARWSGSQLSLNQKSISNSCIFKIGEWISFLQFTQINKGAILFINFIEIYRYKLSER